MVTTPSGFSRFRPVVLSRFKSVESRKHDSAKTRNMEPIVTMKAFGLLLIFATAASIAIADDAVPARRTTVSIQGDAFHINGRPTYEGRTWNGKKIEGLLLNSRMVQATFDDLNPETVGKWAYPDT